MIRFLLGGLCAATCLTTAFGQRVADFTAALEQAKGSKADIAVFVHGSDWNRPGEAAAKIWNDPRFLSGIGPDVLLMDIDRKESPGEADKALAKRNEKGNSAVRSVPAVAVYDSEGRLVGSFSGTAEIEAAGGLIPATKKLLAIRRERDGFWKDAAGASGMMKAGRLGQGLDRMDMGLGPKGIYKPVFEEMKKADPEDKSGYIAKYSFSGEKLVDLALDKAEKKEFGEAEKEFDKWDANPRLSAKQKQELQAARFALYQRWPEKKDKVRPVLEKMRDADPKSELGQAAVNYLNLLFKDKKKGEPQA
ncbi:hypothetical protein [Luteolibacter sp. LG18]|uniref:hypothetical protein n=1 Tax=Luteolibacter sp. LG18 TaxID=2819286 RepID=UPI002B2C2D48|nr:hypothetical protein llg_10030 [Luteolibacter sp. LG18]